MTQEDTLILGNVEHSSSSVYEHAFDKILDFRKTVRDYGLACLLDKPTAADSSGNLSSSLTRVLMLSENPELFDEFTRIYKDPEFFTENSQDYIEGVLEFFNSCDIDRRTLRSAFEKIGLPASLSKPEKICLKAQSQQTDSPAHKLSDSECSEHDIARSPEINGTVENNNLPSQSENALTDATLLSHENIHKSNTPQKSAHQTTENERQRPSLPKQKVGDNKGKKDDFVKDPYVTWGLLIASEPSSPDLDEEPVEPSPPPKTHDVHQTDEAKLEPDNHNQLEQVLNHFNDPFESTLFSMALWGHLMSGNQSENALQGIWNQRHYHSNRQN
ncbi:hypothetical protein GZ77_01430 [Endozoicomonas montiporae]|uniref:Uncharacterized protein n=2 Tax=Endozoicomonas montiporae TaxID=1027273 RepID=A0A081NA70_9GAMM|nr:hypothetical protein [Endozoicomonas montiporae]AMO56976.1 hypothetical protein EZMO1_2936 [Endozoicomonas montiporae CL-33]KEQ15343.1 hypothetical protein GZ77_01430 [Endozoicomonas montiporae]